MIKINKMGFNKKQLQIGFIILIFFVFFMFSANILQFFNNLSLENKILQSNSQIENLKDNNYLLNQSNEELRAIVKSLAKDLENQKSNSSSLNSDLISKNNDIYKFQSEIIDLKEENEKLNSEKVYKIFNLFEVKQVVLFYIQFIFNIGLYLGIVFSFKNKLKIKTNLTLISGSIVYSFLLGLQLILVLLFSSL